MRRPVLFDRQGDLERLKSVRWRKRAETLTESARAGEYVDDWNQFFSVDLNEAIPEGRPTRMRVRTRSVD